MKSKSGHFRNTGVLSWLASDCYMETLQTEDPQILFCVALVLLSQLRRVGLQTNSASDATVTSRDPEGPSVSLSARRDSSGRAV